MPVLLNIVVQVGEVSYVWPNRSVKRQDKDTRLQILVRAEGPTRVLFIIDLLVCNSIGAFLNILT